MARGTPMGSVAFGPAPRHRRGGAPLVAAWALLVLAGGARAQTVSYTGSLSYSTGDYVFTERTHSFWLSNGLGVAVGDLSISASIPLVLQNSGVVSVVAGQPYPTGGESHGTVGRWSGTGKIGTGRGRGSGSGGTTEPEPTDSTVVFRDAYEAQVGDPSLFGSYTLYSGFGSVRSFGVRLGAKAPLRSLESGVGTGAWDVGAGASATLGSGRTWVFLDAAWWWFGDMPELELQDGPMYSVGVSRAFMDARLSVLASLAGSSSFLPEADPPISASLGMSLLFPGAGRALSGGVSLGLTDTASDFSSYVGWSIPLGVR